MKIVIIGYGVVGRNMNQIFTDADIHDPPLGLAAEGDYDIGIVCVPTEMAEDGSADTRIVSSVIGKWQGRCEAFCIKSTIPPGTTEIMNKRLEARNREAKCVFSPEYFGGTQHANGVDYDFVILGGPRKAANKIAEAYKETHTALLRIEYTDSRTAEIVKYMENCWLATKVTFCNEFFRIANQYDRDYDEIRELWLMDPRVNRSHSFVYREHPWYQSHCLDKDPVAIVAASEQAGYVPEFIKAVIGSNERFKNR